MCGIVGIYPAKDITSLRVMNDCIVYRGPDDEGYYFDESSGVALGMRRLSIIDLEQGSQPIANNDNTVWVVCNGEIYNSPELRKELIKRGHVFRSHNSDVEVLVHLYEEKGTDLLHELNGMFSFVIYDQCRKLLFGARDRLGIKPLYYSHRNGKLAFASELKSLTKLPWVSREIDRQSLSDYLSFQFIPAPESPFAGIKKIPAGHHFVYQIGSNNLKISPYWKLTINPVQKNREEWIERFQYELRHAVQRWTLSDVPIGVSLSGGIDSAALVGMLAENGHNSIRTFSVGFTGVKDQRYNELPLARLVAERWGTEHTEYHVSPALVLSDLETMVYHLDEPYGGGLPSWYVFQRMAEDVKVALTGTGGDELFGNYGKAGCYSQRKSHTSRAIVKAILKNHSIAEAIDILRYPHASFSWMYFRDFDKRKILFSDTNGLEGVFPTEEIIEDVWRESRTQDPRDIVPLTDFPNQLAEEFLQVTDRFSMAHSIEARVPFLDHTLVETVMQIPADIRVGHPNPKQFLLDSVRHLIPEEIFNARKRGFILPLKEWTRNELQDMIEAYLAPSYLAHQGIFSSKLYQEFVVPHMSGVRDYTDFVWTLLMFQLWHVSFVN